MYVPWGQELRTKEKEEEARRRRGGGGGKKTRKWNLRRVMTLAVRPKTLLLQCLRVLWVCARCAPRNCRKNCLGMRWGVCAQSGKQGASRSMKLRSLGMRWVCSAQDLDFCLFLRNG